jgi:hypothetical protein
VARRVPRLSTTFRRRLDTLGVRAGTREYRAVFATISALETGALPGAADHETEFSPGRAYVRRVAGHNLWIPYRFDDDHIFVMTARGQPPVPLDE